MDLQLASIAKARSFGDDCKRAQTRVAQNVVPQSVGRVSQPADIGAVVASLASPAAVFTNGANFRIDGGFRHWSIDADPHGRP